MIVRIKSLVRFLGSLSSLMVVMTFFVSCSDDDANNAIGPVDNVTFLVNVRDQSDDRFKVKVLLPQLSSADNIFQFAATAPGIYSIADIGRFIRDFKAFDKNGKALSVEHVTTNQWSLSDPVNTAWIEYTSRDTWDTTVTADPIYKMSGTSLEADHVLLNPMCVMGYPANFKDQKMLVKLTMPSGWKTGTALETDAEGFYVADDFDRLVDSPFLIGNLTEAQQTVSGSEVDIYCYSKDGTISAAQLSTDISVVLDAAEQFLGDIPVDRYAFLFHYGEFNSGAWEHSYSSEYVLRTYSSAQTRTITAHEFFHIVTPLNIHSEIIGNFNFVTPTPSQHLWLYEGVTEWAAHTMLLRAQKTTEQVYWNTMITKILNDRMYYDPSFSLTEISQQSYEPAGQQEYGNVYSRGALVAMLLDIRLLQLSNGERGLRDVILDLIQAYGADAPFDENNFFASLVDMTYPEIESFINMYIIDSQPLPFQEYFYIVGLNYVDNGVDRPTLAPVDSPTALQTLLHDAWINN
jgi:predicted metalloprotease with PDZ domain